MQAHMPIGEFSRLTGIRTENLRFYHRIGLLIPEIRGENGYRYYTQRQLDLAFLIGDLRALGVGLEEIERYAGERSPERMLALFSRQGARIEKEIERLRSIRELMQLRSEIVKEALQYGDNALFLEERKREPIFLCPLLENAGMEEGLILSYNYAAEHGLNLSYPFGAVLSHQSLENSAAFPVLRYYFKARRGYNAWKPEGTYAVAYSRCTNEQFGEVYERLSAFIRENNLLAAGEAYEAYPLDELTTQDGEPGSIRIEVLVKPLLAEPPQG